MYHRPAFSSLMSWISLIMQCFRRTLPLAHYWFQGERPGEVSCCTALVPEAGCRSEVSTGLGTCGWLCVDRLSLGDLPRESSLERCFPPEGGWAAWGSPWRPVLVTEATCGQAGAGSGRAGAGRGGPELAALLLCRRALTGGPVPRGWRICPCGRSPTLDCTELPGGDAICPVPL